jgi:hypothetical protein
MPVNSVPQPRLFPIDKAAHANTGISPRVATNTSITKNIFIFLISLLTLAHAGMYKRLEFS